MKYILGYSEIIISIPYSSEVENENMKSLLNEDLSESIFFKLSQNQEPTNFEFSNLNKQETVLNAKMEVYEDSISYVIEDVPPYVLEYENELIEHLYSEIKKRISNCEYDINLNISDADLYTPEYTTVLNPILEDKDIISIISEMNYDLDIGDDELQLIFTGNDENFSMSIKHQQFNEEINFNDIEDEISQHISENRELKINSEDHKSVNSYIQRLILDESNSHNIDHIDLLDQIGFIEDGVLDVWFMKHGDRAEQLLENFYNHIFTKDPVCSKINGFDHIIDNNKEKFEFLECWVDLVKIIKYETEYIFEVTDLEKLNKNTSDDILIDNIPWKTECFDLANKIVDKYESDSFCYDEQAVREDMLVSLEEKDNIRIVYRILNYGYLKSKNYNGVFMPKCWIATPVVATVDDPNIDINRNDLYRHVRNKPDERVFTQEDIENSRLCTRDILKPSIREDGYREKFTKTTQFDRLKEKVRKSMNEGYEMYTLTVEDLLNRGSTVEFEMSGWHTGSLCSEFPFEFKREGDDEYQSFQAFSEGGGMISYKTSESIRIRLDVDIEDVDPEYVEEEMDYSLDSRIVIALHSLP